MKKRGICLLVNQPAHASLIERVIYGNHVFTSSQWSERRMAEASHCDSPLISEGVSVEGERDALVG